jgi:hypothetical protein
LLQEVHLMHSTTSPQQQQATSLTAKCLLLHAQSTWITCNMEDNQGIAAASCCAHIAAANTLQLPQHD